MKRVLSNRQMNKLMKKQMLKLFQALGSKKPMFILIKRNLGVMSWNC